MKSNQFKKQYETIKTIVDGLLDIETEATNRYNKLVDNKVNWDKQTKQNQTKIMKAYKASRDAEQAIREIRYLTGGMYKTETQNKNKNK